MTTRRSTVLALAAPLTLAAAAHAGAPSYDQYALYFRTNFSVNPGGSFNIPPNNFINSESIDLNEQGHVSARISVNAMGNSSVWAGDIATGAIIYNDTTGSVLGSTTINNSGRITWHQSFGALDGVYGVDLDGSNGGIITNRPLGASSYGNAQINDAGLIGYRAGFAGSGNALVVLDTEGDDTIIAAETGVDFMSPYSFIFTPAFNGASQTACKVRIGPGTAGSRPDEIRLFEADGSSALLAVDDDGDPMSIFTGFDNSCALNDHGVVAFVAGLAGGERGVFISDGERTVEIARESTSDVGDIEFFAPDINNDGVVVFRAFDDAGLRAIWAGNGDWLVRVVTENDILPSDLGDARVDQETSSNPVFGGSPVINNLGQVGFNCGLTPPANNQIEWGTGVWVVTPTLAGPCLGDCDDSGTVDFNDLVAMLFEFGNTDDGACNADETGRVDFNDLVTALFLFGPCE